MLGDNTPLGVLIAAAAAAAGIAAFKWRCDGKKSLELWRPGLLGAGRSEGATLMISNDSIASWGWMAIFWRSCPCSKSQGSISQANNDAGEARDVEHRSHPYRFHVLEVPTAHLGDHYRHRFDLGRCCEAWVPSTCSGNAPHGLQDPCLPSHQRCRRTLPTANRPPRRERSFAPASAQGKPSTGACCAC